jgi:hypothetical protein
VTSNPAMIAAPHTRMKYRIDSLAAFLVAIRSHAVTERIGARRLL